MGIGNLNPFDPNTAVAITNLGNEMEGEAKEDNEEEAVLIVLCSTYNAALHSVVDRSCLHRHISELFYGQPNMLPTPT